MKEIVRFFFYTYIMYTGEPRETHSLVGHARRASFYTPPRNRGGRVIFRFVHIIRPKRKNDISFRSVHDGALLDGPATATRVLAILRIR